MWTWLFTSIASHRTRLPRPWHPGLPVSAVELGRGLKVREAVLIRCKFGLSPLRQKSGELKSVCVDTESKKESWVLSEKTHSRLYNRGGCPTAAAEAPALGAEARGLVAEVACGAAEVILK